MFEELLPEGRDWNLLKSRACFVEVIWETDRSNILVIDQTSPCIIIIIIINIYSEELKRWQMSPLRKKLVAIK